MCEIFSRVSKNCSKLLLLSSYLSLRPSVRRHGTTWLQLKELSWTWYFSIFRKSAEEIQVSLQSDKSNVYFIRRPINFLIISRSVVVRVKSVSDKFCRENQNTCFMSSNFFFSKIMLLWDNVKNNCTDGQTTRDNTIRCMRTAGWVYKHNQNMSCLLLFHCHNSRTSTPKCYVIVYCLSCVLQFQLLYKKLSQHY